MLTPSQEKILKELLLLSSTFHLILQGENGSGKHIIAMHFFETLQVKVTELDLCSLSLSGPLTPQKFYSYLLSLSGDWIYIRHWDKVKEIFEDYGTRNRFFLRYSLSKFSERTQGKIFLSSALDPRVEGNFWIVKHETRVDDVAFLLNKEFQPSQIKTLSAWAGKVKLEFISQALAYARTRKKIKEELFREAIIRLSGSRLEAEKTVEKTTPEVNLIGMGGLLDEIKKSILGPMELNLEEIPLKKGIVLSGPPGTGKTSIGRWLAFQLKGKFYLVDGSVGVSGNNLLTNVADTFEKAYQNSPAVVFIDDVDLFFEHPDTYRSFLTLLDGLENKERGRICIIVTCMNISSIPSSLVRGGRLELCLETKLPNLETRIKILEKGFERVTRLLTRLNKNIKVNDKFIHQIGIQLEGWNCADVQRCIDDILRTFLVDNDNIEKIANNVITAIQRQYELVKRPEDKPPNYYL